MGGRDIIIGSEGLDFIDGGSDFDTINYGRLSSGIALKPAGEINKGSAGIDTLFSVERVIAPIGQFNLIDASTASGNVYISVCLLRNSLNVRNISGLGTRNISANLPTRLLQIFDIPSVGTLNIRVVNFTDVVGTQGNDAFIGSLVDNFINGQNGDDFITASRGDDTIFGGDGFDTIDYSALNLAITIGPGGIVKKVSERVQTLRFVSKSLLAQQVRPMLLMAQQPLLVFPLFDLYVSNSRRFDAVAGVQTTAFVGLLIGDFTLAAGQTLGVFIGA